MASLLDKRRSEVLSRIQEQKEKMFASCEEVTFADDVQQLLYSPDEFGMLDLSLSRVFSGQVRPEIMEYAKNNMFKPPVPNRFSSADDALDSIFPSQFQYGKEKDFVANEQLMRFKRLVEKHKNVE